MNKVIIVAIGFSVLVVSMCCFEERRVVSRTVAKEFQVPPELGECTYYTLVGSRTGEYVYSCVKLTKKELDGVVQKLSDPTIIDALIDDRLIARLTSSKNDIDKVLTRVLNDHKGFTVKKILKMLQKRNLLKKIADVLPRLLGDIY